MQINSMLFTDYNLAFNHVTKQTEDVKAEKPEIQPAKNETAEKKTETPKVVNESEISLNFSLDDKTDEIVIKMLNEKTGEVVQQIPTEVSLKLAANYQRLQEISPIQEG